MQIEVVTLFPDMIRQALGFGGEVDDAAAAIGNGGELIGTKKDLFLKGVTKLVFKIEL